MRRRPRRRRHWAGSDTGTGSAGVPVGFPRRFPLRAVQRPDTAVADRAGHANERSRVLGELYEAALAGRGSVEVEDADGVRMPLLAVRWLRPIPGDTSLLDRCRGPVLDVGSGPGRLTVALAERGVPALGIDVTPYAVRLARSAGALVMMRDVFERVPAAGRWATVLLADGNIGIGGDPAALLRRIGELLAPCGVALVEVQPTGVPLRRELVRLRRRDVAGAWFPWAVVGADGLADLAGNAGLTLGETWVAGGRWFGALRHRGAVVGGND